MAINDITASVISNGTRINKFTGFLNYSQTEIQGYIAYRKDENSIGYNTKEGVAKATGNWVGDSAGLKAGSHWILK